MPSRGIVSLVCLFALLGGLGVTPDAASHDRARTLQTAIDDLPALIDQPTRPRDLGVALLDVTLLDARPRATPAALTTHRAVRHPGPRSLVDLRCLLLV